MNFTPYRDRASWSALAPKSTRPLEINGPITVHWAGGGLKWGSIINTEDAHLTWMEKRMRAIQLFHMNSRGWSDFAYSWAADPWGHSIWEGRGLDIRPASQGTTVGNNTSHSILVATGLGDGPVTDECLDLVDEFTNYLHRTEGTDDLLVGHRDWKATTCPGDFLYNALTDLNADKPVDGTGQPVMEPGHLDDVLAIFTQKGGYGVVDSDGTVAMFGEAEHHGDVDHLNLAAPIVDAESTPSGEGYYLVAADGGLFTFGDAAFLGSLGDVALNEPIVAIEVQEGGYWMVAADGGIFAFGLDFHGRPTVV
jgi:hypothetical protein